MDGQARDAPSPQPPAPAPAASASPPALSLEDELAKILELVRSRQEPCTDRPRSSADDADAERQRRKREEEESERRFRRLRDKFADVFSEADRAHVEAEAAAMGAISLSVEFLLF
jgi:hypothetical protein